MKTNILILVILIACLGANAQTATKTNPVPNEPASMQTLFNNTGHLGWWVSPDLSWTQIENRNAFLAGLSGGVIVNHSFSIGLAGYGIMNSQNLRFSGINDTTDVYLYGGYGGFKMEYRLFPLKTVNVAFPLLIGGGGIAYNSWSINNPNNDQNDFNMSNTYDSYFVVEPGVAVGINLLKFMRFDFGASYRYAAGIELPHTNGDLMNGFNLNIGLKFGRF